MRTAVLRSAVVFTEPITDLYGTLWCDYAKGDRVPDFLAINHSLALGDRYYVVEEYNCRYDLNQSRMMFRYGVSVWTRSTNTILGPFLRYIPMDVYTDPWRYVSPGRQYFENIEERAKQSKMKVIHSPF